MKQFLADALIWVKTRLQPHTATEAVLGLGGLFLIGVAIAALLPDHIDRQSAQNGAAPVAMPAALPNVTAGGTMGTMGAMPGLQPFRASPPIQFGGRVTQVLSVGSEFGWGQVHIWINSGTGTLQEVSLAPQSYLQQIGCPPLADARVSGAGFRYDLTRPGAELYAKLITVAGTTCRLRDDEGLALWLNPTQ